MRPLVAFLCWASLVGTANAQSFTGPYIGLELGRVTGTADADFSVDVGPPLGTVAIDDAVPFDGFEIGALAGLRATFANGFSFGLELAGNLGRVEGRESDILNVAETINVDGRLRRRGEASLSARAGARIAPGTLLYGIAGVQAARFEFSAEGAGLDLDEGGLVPGWYLGAGAERALSERASLRFEYVQYNYGRLDTRAGPVDISVSPDEQSFRVGLLWSFF